MTQLSRRTAMSLLLPASALLAGCQSQATSGTTPGGDMNDADLDFVTNAQNIILFDREECTTAQTQAKTPEIRALAARLLADANAFDAKLAPILAETGIKPPTVLRSDLRVRLARMRLDRGIDFDRTFVNDQIATHEEIINRQSMMRSTPHMNAKIEALAKQGSEILERNLVELKRFQRQMMLAR